MRNKKEKEKWPLVPTGRWEVQGTLRGHCALRGAPVYLHYCIHIVLCVLYVFSLFSHIFKCTTVLHAQVNELL